ncbi:nuclear transport factor 2 family protein [Streptomyces canus]|uniref:nuclear transport factor 2 family protein n=1 Tax=Streptomyces canus TaxID=58343 RepID=UPI0036BDAADA
MTAQHADPGDNRRYDDLADIQQMLARYAVAMTRGDTEQVLAVFTPDGNYSAFGDTYPLDDFPALIAAAPQGLFMTGTPVVDFADDGDSATGTQPLCFVEHSAHALRIGYYDDTYRRTPDGWRLHTRAMTFIRRSGAHDSGRPHAFERTRT